MAQSHLSHQQLKPIAPDGRGTRLALILVNDLDSCLFPSQVVGTLDQVILPGRTAAMLAHLQQRRLAHIDHRGSRQVIRTDFERLLPRR
ncbi:MAG TPA: hypothetical protein VFN02_09350, partial [Ktedonobacteraceae bacterium]|nr:hypothetical protein [Ktedonobacteraceae bacterium]